MADVICPDCQRLTSGRCGRHSTVIFPISGSTERRVPYRCPVCEGCGTLRRDGSSLVMTPHAIFEEVQSEAAVPNPTPDTSPERPRPNELWRHRDSGIEFKVTRTARRSVFGILTIPGVNLSTSSQLLYTQIDAKWERVHA